jgi:hypothetical protein
MAGPRIGRSDVLAALVRPQFAEPVHTLDDVAERAHEIAETLAHLTRLTGFCRRRIRRAEVERRARLDGLHDRAIALWWELGRVAGEASGQTAPERDARIG